MRLSPLVALFACFLLVSLDLYVPLASAGTGTGDYSNVFDSIGTANSNTANFVNVTNGQVGSFSGVFDGTSSYASFPTGTSTWGGTGSQTYSVGFWVRPDANNFANFPVIVSNTGPTNGCVTNNPCAFFFSIRNTGKFEMSVGLNNGACIGATNVDSTTVATVGTWYNIVGVLDTTQPTQGNRLKLYVNGALEASATIAGSFTMCGDSTSQPTIGIASDKASAPCACTIDQVTIWTVGLGASDVTTFFNSGTALSPTHQYTFETGFSGNPTHLKTFSVQSLECDIASLNQTVCSRPLGILPFTTVTVSYQDNNGYHVISTGGTNASGWYNFTWLPTTSYVFLYIQAFATGHDYYTISPILTPSTGYNASFNVQMQRSSGYSFFNIFTHACAVALQNALNCANDLGPVPNTTVNVTGIVTLNGNTDSTGYIQVATNVTGIFNVTISKTGYNGGTFAFQNPALSYTRTLYLGIPEVTCIPASVNATIPAAANFTVLASGAGPYYADVDVQLTTGYFAVARGSVKTLLPGATSTVSYPARGYTDFGLPGWRGSYYLVISNANNDIKATCPFIIYDGVGAAPTMPPNPATAFILSNLASVNTPPGGVNATNSLATTQNDLNLVQSGTALLYADSLGLGIPNLYVFYVVTLVIAVAIALIVHRRSQNGG